VSDASTGRSVSLATVAVSPDSAHDHGSHMRAARVDTTARELTKVARPRSKYHAVATVVDGIRFASKAEARRYGELKLLEKAGEIRSLVLQPQYPLVALNECGDATPVGRYVADFAYERFLWPGRSKECDTVVEDVKGVITALARWKIKHVKAQYGIDVQIVKR
jgi:hypothetical protein